MELTPNELPDQIDSQIGEIRTDALDISFGEIINLHAEDELIIQPEYQRLFRWSEEQQSRLVESILLELPIPQVFVIENEEGVFELIDGLQRISSMIHFLDSSKIDLEPLSLSGCDIVPELNGHTFNSLPLRLRLKLKRSAVRMIIIKRQSKPFLKYEMFKRLNTGGEILTPQEIRNCSSRMVGESGTEFYSFIQESAQFAPFKLCTSSISEADLERKGDEELVLRFFALKNGMDLFKGNVRDWLDEYMESILLGSETFDYHVEKAYFSKTFGFLAECLGRYAFVRYKDDRPLGSLAPAYFEAITTGVLRHIDHIRTGDADAVREAIVQSVQSNDFKEVTGSGASSIWKLKKRTSLITEAVESALDV